MTAKEKCTEFIKSYLKPVLKLKGFKTSGLNWWKFVDDFFVVINLQNSQWNSKDRLSFCFNIGIGLTKNLNSTSKKRVTLSDATIDLREDDFLSKKRNQQKYREDGWLGYLMTEGTNLQDFTNEFKIDFENEILPKLEKLKTIQDCINFSRQFEFFGDLLQNQIVKAGNEKSRK